MSTTKLFSLIQSELSYNEPNKKAFHAEAKKVLRAVAKKMGLPSGSYDISSSKGGIAVSGEIHLRTDRLYVTISAPVFIGRTDIMYRQCNSRKDSTGGSNQWVCVSRLLDDDVISRFVATHEAAMA